MDSLPCTWYWPRLDRNGTTYYVLVVSCASQHVLNRRSLDLGNQPTHQNLKRTVRQILRRASTSKSPWSSTRRLGRWKSPGIIRHRQNLLGGTCRSQSTLQTPPREGKYQYKCSTLKSFAIRCTVLKIEHTNVGNRVVFRCRWVLAIGYLGP